ADSAGRDGLSERLEVALVLVCVDLGERGERAVENVAGAEIACDCDRVARARVCFGEGPATYLRMRAQPPRTHLFDAHRGFGIPELADVVVALHAVQSVAADPTEQNVARRLHEPLALDDSLAVGREKALAEERLEHRGLRLLGLEKKGVVVVTAEHENDPVP